MIANQQLQWIRFSSDIISQSLFASGMEFVPADELGFIEAKEAIPSFELGMLRWVHVGCNGWDDMW